MLTADRLRWTTTTRPIADVQLPAIDETSRADGSRFGGVLANWSAEARSSNSTYPRWRRVGFSDNKIIGIGYATSEIMADGDLFEADRGAPFGRSSLLRSCAEGGQACNS